MHIVIFHQYYLMPGRPGGSRFNELARIWSEAGHKVTVISGNIDYSTGSRPIKYRGTWFTKERDGDVDVIRCYVPESYNKSYVGRAWAYFGYALSSLSASFVVHDADVIIASSPPLTAVIPGWFASTVRRGVPWVFEMRDLWPESAVATGVLSESSVLTKGLYALERWASKRASIINVLTPAFRDDLLRRNLASAEKIVVVPNGADTELFQPGQINNEYRTKFNWGSKFVALYAGAHGRANGLDVMVEAAALLRHRNDIFLASVGNGPEQARLRAAAAERGLSNIGFHGAVSKAAMPLVVNAANLGIAILQKSKTFETVYPNKVFDYMSCAKPILVSIAGVSRELVCEQAKAGWYAAPGDSRALANAIVHAADHPDECEQLGAQGRKWVSDNMARTQLAKRYVEALQSVANAHKYSA